MKINMWKLLIAGLFASAALAGCEDNRNNFMVDDTLSFVNEEQYAGVSVYNGKYEFAILKNGKGSKAPKRSSASRKLPWPSTTRPTAPTTRCCRRIVTNSPLRRSGSRMATPVNSSRLRGMTQPSSPSARVRSMPFRLSSPRSTTRWPSTRTQCEDHQPQARFDRHGEGTGNTVPPHRYARGDYLRRQHRARQCHHDNGSDGELRDRQQPRGGLQPGQRDELPGRARRVRPGWTPPARRSQQARRRPSSRARSTPTSCSRAATSISWATCSCRCASPPRRWTVSPSPPRSCMSPSRWTRN